MINTINELYNVQKDIWKSENEKYFGITPLEQWINKDAIDKHLLECSDKFWNNGTNELKKLFENGRCKDIDKLVPGSYELVFDAINGIVCLYAKFKINEDQIKRAPLAYLPYANHLSWFLNNTEYVLRISANVNYSLITRVGNICKYQKTWTYNVDTDEFNVSLNDFDPYDKLTEANRTFLEYCLGAKNNIVDENGSKRAEITRDNFTEALKSIPEYDKRSIMYFKFSYIEEMFELIRKSSRFANPLMKVSIPINVVKMFTSQRNRSESIDDGSFTNIVLANNELFALENSRTIIYKSNFNTSFNFIHCEKLFDAFKTSTNKSAGRSRLILDNVTIKNGILWNNIGDRNISMYELALNDEYKISNNLSILSCSRFSSNNDAKRIMMTAKLRAQAIQTAGEVDRFTHETPARVVFGDFEGFNYGDSIIISKSFAKRLESKTTKKIKIDFEDYTQITKKYGIGDQISVRDFNDIIGSSMYSNYRDIILDDINREYMTISARIPFSIGDKITNLHGSKGIVSLILNDEDMPHLKNDIGDFKAGPFDIIISALSVFRRKSLGQLFEAWALASDINDVNNIQDAIAKYGDHMKEFSEKSTVLFNGTETVKPCGINMIIRLDHNAVSKHSKSLIKSNYAKMLKFGEMELLNLAARGLYDIMNELDIRSVSKHHNSLQQIQEMQRNGNIIKESSNNLRFFNILQTVGFDFNLREPINLENVNPEFIKLQNLLTDNKIDLFKGGE